MKSLTLIDKAFLLKKTPLFGTLDLDLLLPIADKLGLSEYDSGDMIFGIGEQANRMFWVVQGKVEVRDGTHTTELEFEDFFGDEALFNEQPRSYEALSKTKSFLLILSKTNLFTIISESPAVAIGFLQVYTSALPFRLRKHT